MGVVKIAFLLVVYTIVGALILLYCPGIPPDIHLEPFNVTPPVSLTPNGKLDSAELVFDGDFIGPESVAIRNDDEIYTGVVGGHIVRVKNGKAESIVQTGRPCAGHWEADICGRPLGMRFDASGKLIVADASQGLVKVDVDKRTVETILPRFSKIGDSESPLNFADDLDIGKDGSIYFSDVGLMGSIGDLFADMLGEPTGRLIKFDPKTKKSQVLIDGIRFANGVQLSKQEDFVMVSESVTCRILRHYLSGPKKGKTDVLIDGLPGYPDNIRLNGNNGYFIALFGSRSQENPTGLDLMAPYPLLRKLILRFQNCITSIFETLYLYAPNEYIGRAISYAKHLGPLGDITKVFNTDVTIVDVDENGNILGSLQKQKGKISFITEVSRGDKYTYFGSAVTSQLWRVKNDKLK